MDPLVLFWIIAAIVLGVIEGATAGLVAVWFIVGAVAAAITAVFTSSMYIQVAVFVVVSAVVLITTRPAAKRLAEKGHTPTNFDMIIGKDAVVLEAIDPIKGKGQIKVGGQVWSAKSEGDISIKKDTLVKVKNIAGVCAVVAPKGEEE